MEQPAVSMAAGPAAQQPAPSAPDQGSALGESVQATPEEQDAYNKVVAVAWQLVYDEQVFPKVLDMLRGEGDPVEGLAQTAAMVIGRVAGAAEQNGQKIPGDVMFHAASEIFEDLANLSSKAQIHDFAADRDGMEAGYFRALDGFRTMLQQAGKIDRQAASADMEQLIQMDKGGQLEALFRRMSGAEGDGGPGPGASEAPPAEPKSRGLMQEER